MNWLQFPALWAVILLLSFPTFGLGQTVETKAGGSGWTPDLLKAHYDAIAVKDAEIRALHKEMSELRDNQARELREAADKRYEQRFQAQEAAQLSYKTASNEFRGTLSDQASRFISRSELGGYAYGFVAVMGVLVAWLAWSSSRGRQRQSEWRAEVIEAIRNKGSQ